MQSSEKTNRIVQGLSALIHENRANELHAIGQFELFDAGRRARAAFPSLARDSPAANELLFRSTTKSRTAASATAFGMGFFGNVCRAGTNECLPTAIGATQLPDDPLLRFYTLDQHYIALQSELSDRQEVELLRPIYAAIAEELQERHGLKLFREQPLLVGDLWAACQAQASLMQECDLCALLSDAAMALLEWTSDFDEFLMSGPGHPLNCCLGLPLLRDILAALEGAADGSLEKGRRGRFHFAHAATLLPLACLLGVGENHLRNETLSELLNPFPEARRSIKKSEFMAPFFHRPIWKCADLMPMAANLLITLNRSSTVSLYWNEELVPGPWCNATSQCPLSEFVINVLETSHRYGDCTCSVYSEGSCEAF